VRLSSAALTSVRWQAEILSQIRFPPPEEGLYGSFATAIPGETKNLQRAPNAAIRALQVEI
jgi:hypothetical protein